MAISREERLVRIHTHTKQERMDVRNGIPHVSEMKEGVPVLSSTNEGVVQYIRYKDLLYKNVMKDSLHISDVVGFADDGYVKFDNGLIMQWGQETATATTETVTFPIPFPNECLNVTCTDYASGDTGGLGSATGIKTLPTTTTAVFSCYTAADTFFWQAIGY
jgi:hypothetical protein